MLNSVKIKSIKKLPQKKEVYDISHKISEKNFLDEHPNLIANNAVISNCSRHAGGIIITDKTMDNMPVIKSGGVLQTPWPEGLNFRHLEEFGFLKFDILGLGTLRMFEECIRRILKRETGKDYISFKEISDYYYQNVHPDNNELTDPKVFETVYHQGRYCGIFQFVQKNVQNFTMKMKPTSILDLSIITSIFRPGPLCLSGDSEIFIEKHTYNGRNFYSHKTIKQLYKEFNFPKKKCRYKYKLASLDESTNRIFRNEILNVFSSGKKKVYSIKTRLNYVGTNVFLNSSPKNKTTTIEMKSTLDHRFLTLDGWKRLEDITTGEYLFYMNRNKFDGDTRKNSRSVGIMNERNFSNVAFRNYKHKCLFCDWKEGSLDVNHLEGNRKTNNDPENLCFLCPNHHRMYTEGRITKEQCLFEMEKNKLILNDDVRMVQYISKEYVGEEETYDISVKGPNHNFIAGGFVVHNSVSADKLYLGNRLNPENITFKHPLLEEVLEPTSGLIVFQEQLQLIYHKLAGVPLDETDSVRKAFTKKDISNREASEAARLKLKNEFLVKCKESNDIPEEVSSDIFDEIEKFVAYSFNKSHAVSYAIISWQCAWFMTYFPDDWVATYLDYCTVSKGKASGKDDPKAVALGEVRQMGYKIGKPDINLSERDFVTKHGTVFPSFASLKHVGDAVVDEIMANRPYNSLEDLLFTSDGKWKHVKLNRRAMDTLVKLGAFETMNLVGPGKTFDNYAQMEYVIIENGDVLKKIAARKKNNDWRAKLQELIEESKKIEDWGMKEKITISKDLSGSVDMSLIIPDELTELFETASINSVDDWEDDSSLVWAVVSKSKKATTKNGKAYIKASIYGLTGAISNLFIWGYNPEKHKMLEADTLMMAKMKKSDFGYSCFYTGIQILNEKKK